MNIVIIAKPENKCMLMDDMIIGEVGEVQTGEFKDHIVLKCYSSIVSLTNPSVTWNLSGNAESVDVFPDGTSLHITFASR